MSHAYLTPAQLEEIQARAAHVVADLDYQSMADVNCVYGAHRDDETKPCRCCWVFQTAERLRAAYEVERKLSSSAQITNEIPALERSDRVAERTGIRGNTGQSACQPRDPERCLIRGNQTTLSPVEAAAVQPGSDKWWREVAQKMGSRIFIAERALRAIALNYAEAARSGITTALNALNGDPLPVPSAWCSTCGVFEPVNLHFDCKGPFHFCLVCGSRLTEYGRCDKCMAAVEATRK